jgi:cytochrome oxidase Cu insertion factor (SCO1/SenC/PrrC family)
MCLVLGALGGVAAAQLESQPAAARFVPPREEARDFRLRDQDGRWTTLAAARGDVVVLTFLYSSCRDLCPAQASEIAQAVTEVGDGVQVYGVSVDPVGDTPERVRRWLEAHGLYGGPVRFLIGTRRELAPVWAAYGIVPIGATPEEAAAAAVSAERMRAREPQAGVYTPPKRSASEAAHEPYPDANDFRYRGRSRHTAGLDFEHSAYVMLIDRRGEQRLGIPFELLDPESLARDLRVLKREP